MQIIMIQLYIKYVIEVEQLICSGAEALLRFDYYDVEKNDDSEGFATTHMDAYDRLVEITDPDWVAGYRKTNPRIADLFHIEHYAIFLKSCGLYEFIAKNYVIYEPKEGGLSEPF